MKAIVSLIVFINFFIVVFCNSAGQFISICDATSPLYGCDPSDWIDGNRLKCNQTGQIMSWVSKAVEAGNYTLSFGPNENTPVSQYSPDEIVLLHLRTHLHSAKWRGILMYALDSENNRVGTWEIAPENSAWFQVAEQPCENTLVHNTGVEKPYYITTNWRAPSAGVGDVTFYCLLKEGNANTGAFYYPKGTLTGPLKLTENLNPTPKLNWIRSELGQDCNEACETIQKYCKVEKMREIISEELFTESISPFNLCKLPLLSGCNSLGTTSSVDNLCYFASTNESCTNQNRKFEETTCEAKNTHPGFGQRWCFCEGDIPPPTDPETTKETATNSNTKEDETKSQSPLASGTDTGSQKQCVNNLDCDSGICQANNICFENPENNSTAMKFKFQGVLLIVIGFLTFKLSKFNLFFMIFMLCFIPSINCHNWINSLGRSQGTASTAQPCPAKLSELPHTQVGPEQLFQIEWASGHAQSKTHLVILHEDDNDKLGLHTERFLHVYIDEAPEGINIAQVPEWSKKHRTHTLKDYEPGAIKGEILPGSELYLEVPEVFRQVTDQKLYEYSEEYLERDSYLTYNNPNFPWIETLCKFYHDVNRPLQWDVTNFKIPGRSGFGRYIVHFVWNGYRDCIEVDLLDHFVEFPYGQQNGADTWTVIPHCFFQNYDRVSSSCDDPMMNARATKRTCGGRFINDCSGINVIPWKTPDTIYEGFADVIHIPWESGWCNQTYSRWLDDNTEEERIKHGYVSFAVKPAEATTTQFYFTTSEDPTDPIFHSTCIARTQDRLFEGYEIPKPVKLEHHWRFVNKCISCENRQRNVENYLPRYDLLPNNCVNCDIEPTPVFKQPMLLKNNSKCRSYDGCEDDSRCLKYVGSFIGRFPLMDLEDCSYLVAKDPECSDIFSHEADVSQCQCVLKSDCCLDYGCRPEFGDNFQLYKHTYTIDTPDPLCERGIQIDNSCCSVKDENSSQTEFCDADFDLRPCSAFGPPCSLSAAV